MSNLISLGRINIKGLPLEMNLFHVSGVELNEPQFTLLPTLNVTGRFYL